MINVWPLHLDHNLGYCACIFTYNSNKYSIIVIELLQLLLHRQNQFVQMLTFSIIYLRYLMKRQIDVEQKYDWIIFIRLFTSGRELDVFLYFVLITILLFIISYVLQIIVRNALYFRLTKYLFITNLIYIQHFYQQLKTKFNKIYNIHQLLILKKSLFCHFLQTKIIYTQPFYHFINIFINISLIQTGSINKMNQSKFDCSIRLIKQSDILQRKNIENQINFLIKNQIEKIAIKKNKQNLSQLFQSCPPLVGLENKQCYFDPKFFQGRLLTAWLFIIKDSSNQIKQKIKKMYGGLPKLYTLPYASNLQEAKPFFDSSAAYFKILVDIDNAQILIKDYKKLLPKIGEIYVYNTDLQNGQKRFSDLKQKEKKIKCFYYEIDPILQQIQRYIQNYQRFQNEENKIVKSQKFMHDMLPAYIKLSEQDKTVITAYRKNLYALLKLKDQRNLIEQYIKILQTFVKRIYSTDTQKLTHLQEYVKTIGHIRFFDFKQQTMKKVLQSYGKDSFHYRLVNRMLLVSRQVEDFKPVGLLFSETCHAIKYFYKKQLTNKKNLTNTNTKRGKSFKVYRGAPFSEIQNLKEGMIIELLGFISTSTDKEIAKYFLDKVKDNKGCMIVIEVPYVQSQLDQQMDHGYVDMNELRTDTFKEQKQLLFNALNIYQVTKIIRKDNDTQQYDQIHLKYGVVFQLQKKYNNKIADLNRQEIQIVRNYQHCKLMYSKINNLGDLYYALGQFDKAQEQHKKSKQGGNGIQNKLKLLNIQYNCGKIQESLQLVAQLLQNSNNQILNCKNEDVQPIIQVLRFDQDNLMATKLVNQQIQKLTENDWFEKAQRLYELGQIQFQQGLFHKCERNYISSEMELKIKMKGFEKRRKQLETQKMDRKSIINEDLSCFERDINELQQQQKLPLKQENIFQKQNQRKVLQLLLKINNSQVKCYKTIGDSKKLIMKLKQSEQIYKMYEETFNKQKITEKIGQNKPYENQIENKPFISMQMLKVRAQLLHQTKDQQKMNQAEILIDTTIKKYEQISPLNQSVGKLEFLKATFIGQQALQSMEQCKFKAEIQKDDHNIPVDIQYQFQKNKERFDKKVQQQKIKKSQYHYQKGLAIITYCRGQDHLSTLSMRTIFGKFQYKTFNLSKAIEQLIKVLESGVVKNHTIGAEAALYLSKIYFVTGEITKSSRTIILCMDIIKSALLKEHHKSILSPDSQAEYENIMRVSQIFIAAQLMKCKIFNKEQKHSLALSTIKNIEVNIIPQKLNNEAQKVSYLAIVYQDKGHTYALLRNPLFIHCFQQAIDLRKQQIGARNMANAVCMCSIAKYLIFQNNLPLALKYILEAQSIFSYNLHSHPSNWIPYSTRAYYNEAKGNVVQQKASIQRSSQLIGERYPATHINFLSIKLKQCQVLAKNQYYQQALDKMQDLKSKLEQEVGYQSDDDSQKIDCQEKNSKKKSKDENEYLRKSISKYRNRNEKRVILDKIRLSILLYKEKSVIKSQQDLKPVSMKSMNPYNPQQIICQIKQQVQPVKYKRTNKKRSIEQKMVRQQININKQQRKNLKMTYKSIQQTRDINNIKPMDRNSNKHKYQTPIKKNQFSEEKQQTHTTNFQSMRKKTMIGSNSQEDPDEYYNEQSNGNLALQSS